MSSNDPITTKTNINSAYDAKYAKTCERIKAGEGFINNMNEKDKAAIVLFSSSANITAKMTTNKTETLKLALQKITNSGGTNFNAAISTSISAFNEKDIGAAHTTNRIILLSDGQSTVSDSYLKKALDKKIKIYTIGLGSGSNDARLKYISKYTGGEFYKAYTADELVDIYTEVGFDGDFDKTDTDGDGLYDAVEAAGIRIQNGTIIKGCDPTLKDTDKDGLNDGKEIDPKPCYNEKNIKIPLSDKTMIAKGYSFKMVSDSTKKDSDGDGIIDYDKTYMYPLFNTVFDKDNRPLVKGIYSSKRDKVVTGEMTIVSCTNGLAGHAFLAYKSYVKDTLDFTGLTGGYTYMSWEKSKPCKYSIDCSEYVAIGNAGAGVTGSSQPFESGSTGIDGDDAGIFFNREFANEKKAL